MDEIFIRNLRCFADVGWVKLAPLTLLVGENSTGKTSFLAAIRLAWDLAHGHGNIDFNEDPFQLGAFDQLAHVYGGNRGRAKDIELGHRQEAKERYEIRSTLTQDGSQATVQESSLEIGGLTMKSVREAKGMRVSIEDKQRELFAKATRDFELLPTGSRIDWELIPYLLVREQKSPRNELLERVMQVTRRLRYAVERPYAFAPVRTKPLRTYDPIRQAPHPEGEHVPMFLARLRFTDEKQWLRIKVALEDFGKAAGLFQYLDVRTLGKSESDPFQLRVKIGGPLVNLVDVGYGVSQILPLVVETLSEEGRRLLLIQQPEVHLHPRAQAELGSFLGALVRTRRRRFVVETHSDYTIDRIRADIRDRRGPNPEDVAILYFQRERGGVQIYRIGIDSNGDLTNVPDGYRDFFLHEQRRSLGI